VVLVEHILLILVEFQTLLAFEEWSLHLGSIVVASRWLLLSLSALTLRSFLLSDREEVWVDT
jgi:hypothetical protein